MGQERQDRVWREPERARGDPLSDKAAIMLEPAHRLLIHCTECLRGGVIHC